MSGCDASVRARPASKERRRGRTTRHEEYEPHCRPSASRTPRATRCAAAKTWAFHWERPHPDSEISKRVGEKPSTRGERPRSGGGKPKSRSAISKRACEMKPRGGAMPRGHDDTSMPAGTTSRCLCKDSTMRAGRLQRDAAISRCGPGKTPRGRSESTRVREVSLCDDEKL